MHAPAAVLLAFPGAYFLVAGTLVHDAGAQTVGAVLTAATLGGFAVATKIIRKAMRADNARVTREVVRDELKPLLTELRSQIHDAAADASHAGGEAARAHRRIDHLEDRP